MAASMDHAPAAMGWTPDGGCGTRRAHPTAHGVESRLRTVLSDRGGIMSDAHLAGCVQNVLLTRSDTRHRYSGAGVVSPPPGPRSGADTSLSPPIGLLRSGCHEE